MPNGFLGASAFRALYRSRSGGRYLKIDEFCIQNDGFCIQMMDFVSFCIQIMDRAGFKDINPITSQGNEA